MRLCADFHAGQTLKLVLLFKYTNHCMSLIIMVQINMSVCLSGPSKEYLIFFLFSDKFRVLLFQVLSFCVPDSSRNDQVPLKAVLQIKF